jgi:hypothetical protein
LIRYPRPVAIFGLLDTPTPMDLRSARFKAIRRGDQNEKYQPSTLPAFVASATSTGAERGKETSLGVRLFDARRLHHETLILCLVWPRRAFSWLDVTDRSAFHVPARGSFQPSFGAFLKTAAKNISFRKQLIQKYRTENDPVEISTAIARAHYRLANS